MVKLLEIANALEADHAGRISVGAINHAFRRGRQRHRILRSDASRGKTSMSASVRIMDSSRTSRHVRKVLPAQPIDATQALNLSAGVSNCKVSRGRSLS